MLFGNRKVQKHEKAISRSGKGPINQKEIYDILFKSGTETLRELGRAPKHLGAEIGIVAILHTWGQNLMEHPHLHCIVPCGGLSENGKVWLFPRKSTKKKAFFVHVNVISDLFKKKFLSYFKKLYLSNKLKFVGKIMYLGNDNEFKKLCDDLYEKKWISYIKSPFGGPEQVLEGIRCHTREREYKESRKLGRVIIKINRSRPPSMPKLR